MASFLDRRFLWLLLVCYVAGALVPGMGLWMRDLSFGDLRVFGQSTKITLPMVMLGLLLLNAGLCVRTSQFQGLPRVGLLLFAGLMANIAVPLVYILVASGVTRFWLDAEEVQSMLIGLAIVASMPISGSSTAWSQNANGNVAISLSLVALSTCLSPLTTPLVLRCLGFLAEGENAALLRRIAEEGSEGFLILCIVLPSVVGCLIARWLGETRLERVKPQLKLFNWANLFLLIYANAAAALPDAIAFPDPDFLLTSLGVALGLCTLTFASGWFLAQLCRADAAQRTSLMFALGMNNNGAGMVLASVALADHPRVLLPIICYNLVQHLVAGGAVFCLNLPQKAAKR